MFGIYRTILAIVVLISHFTGLHVASTWCVFGFFCLSGFLMTLLISEPYKGRIGAFFVNRALRLYPLYWATLVLSYMFGLMLWPPYSFAFLKQVLLISRWNDSLAYIPIAWAVTNEIAFYIAIGFGISKTPRRTVIWFALSCLATAIVYVSEYDQADLTTLYFPVWCGSLPFSLGALLYHLRDRMPKLTERQMAGSLVACSFLICGAAYYAGYGYWVVSRIPTMMLAVYLSLVPQAILILTLFQVRSKTALKIDSFVGRFSYPLYIMQFLGFSLALKYGMEREPTPLRGMIVLASTLAVAVVCLVFVDTPIQMLRSGIRDWRRRPRGPAEVYDARPS